MSHSPSQCHTRFAKSHSPSQCHTRQFALHEQSIALAPAQQPNFSRVKPSWISHAHAACRMTRSATAASLVHFHTKPYYIFHTKPYYIFHAKPYSIFHTKLRSIFTQNLAKFSHETMLKFSHETVSQFSTRNHAQFFTQNRYLVLVRVIITAIQAPFSISGLLVLLVLFRLSGSFGLSGLFLGY